ncbi:tripartite motif-containing protein 59-like [Watersipora subatra]|uniref:tripartite motif-containing protein 59-like n=1 Tax=Watersipora subatra TaxID=2589382 RepID=UPI00355BBDEA
MGDPQLNESYRCGYCFEQFNCMTDPRELPCHHVFCKTCLEDDYSEHNNVRCRSCLTEYEMETFDELPKANLNNEDNITPTSLTCDCDNCGGQVAVSYCIDCAVMMCDTHQQVHNFLLGNKHLDIPISTYQLHPGRYKKVMCQKHRGEVFEVCVKCQLKTCINCDSKERKCQDGLTDHTFNLLKTIKEEVTAHFNSLLESANEKLTEICKTDKQIWKVLDEEEVECAKRIQIIEKVRDEQIEMIREESEKLKKQIYEYQRELIDQVESYNTELMAKKERLEESCTEVRKWLRESHVTEKMEQKQQMTDQLMNNTDVTIDCPLTRTPALIHTGKQFVQLPKLVATPTSLTFMSEHSTNSSCYSAAYLANEKLILGCADGVECLNKDSSEVVKFMTSSLSQEVTSVQVYNNNFYILESIGNEKTVYQCLSDVSQKEKLFSFEYPVYVHVICTSCETETCFQPAQIQIL